VPPPLPAPVDFAAIDAFLESLFSGFPGSTAGFDANTVIVGFHFTTSGTLTWLCDRDYAFVGFNYATSSPDLMIAPTILTAIPAGTQTTYGPGANMFIDSASVEHSGFRIPYQAGQRLCVVNSTGTEVYLNCFLLPV
jgi:hypothetical protein